MKARLVTTARFVALTRFVVNTQLVRETWLVVSTRLVTATKFVVSTVLVWKPPPLKVIRALWAQGVATLPLSNDSFSRVSRSFSFA